VAARWWRFNLVGGLGFGVQLALLAALTRLTDWPAGVCVAIAVALTVSHNFAWHTRYTWRDPGGPATDRPRRLRQWVAFNATNGVVSLACNVPVTTALAAAGLPILAANIVAIGTASVVNFVLSDRLVFTR
jgi:putative flippase GtrA